MAMNPDFTKLTLKNIPIVLMTNGKRNWKKRRAKIMMLSMKIRWNVFL